MANDRLDFIIYLFRDFRRFFPLLFAFYGIIIIIYLFFSGDVTNKYIVILFLLFLLYFTLVVYWSKKNPESVYVSLIGSPNAGKTVYLTIFFNEFLRKKIQGIELRPSGDETTELVVSNYSLIKEGKWLPKTPLNEHFQYRGIASLKTGIVSKRSYKIVIEDFAGQYLDEFVNSGTDPIKMNWLHQSLFFKNIVKGDAIFFAIDCEDILKLDSTIPLEKSNAAHRISIVENDLTMAINSILDENDKDGQNRKLHTPLALLFMKFDLLVDNIGANSPIIYERIAKESYKGLISFCETNCINFKIFFISSVGHVKPNGLPPDTISPKDIIDPLIWAIKKV